MPNMNPLAMIADNPVVFEQLSKLLRSKFEEFSVFNIPASMSNELIGQVTRARVEGLMKVEEVLSEISACATVQDTNLNTNPAR